MLLLHVPVRDVHVLQRGVVVLVSVGGEQVAPVLSLMQVVRDVIVLVAVLQGLVLMMSLLPRHADHLFRSAASTHSIDRTSTDGTGQTETVSREWQGRRGPRSTRRHAADRPKERLERRGFKVPDAGEEGPAKSE